MFITIGEGFLEHGLFLCPHCALRLSHFLMDNFVLFVLANVTNI
jgi:hypothetical protein